MHVEVFLDFVLSAANVGVGAGSAGGMLEAVPLQGTVTVTQSEVARGISDVVAAQC